MLKLLVETSHVSWRSFAALPSSPPKYVQPDARQLLFARGFSHFVLAPTGSMRARERGYSEVEVEVELHQGVRDAERSFVGGENGSWCGAVVGERWTLSAALDNMHVRWWALRRRRMACGVAGTSEVMAGEK